MKKILTLAFSLVLILVLKTSATVHEITVSDYQFAPTELTANVGDTIKWIRANSFDGIPHTSTSTSVPLGAMTWSSSDLIYDGETFMYVIMVPGVYNYQCAYHGTSHNMKGSFTVNDVTGLPTPAVGTNLRLVFPNPFTETVKVYYNQPGVLMIFDVLGNKVSDVVLNNPNTPVELNLSNLYRGVYFIAFYEKGKVVETRRIVKEL